MSTRVVTTYTTTSTGAGRIVAKGGGKQRTIPYDHEKGTRDNHRAALDSLARSLGTGTLPRVETIEQDNGRATFIIG